MAKPLGRPRVRPADGTPAIYVRVTAEQRAAYRAALRKNEHLNAFAVAALDREVARRRARARKER